MSFLSFLGSIFKSKVTINNGVTSGNNSMTLITLTEILKIFPTVKSGLIFNFIGPLNDTFTKYQINNPKRISAFLGQIAVESNYFSALIENLNYNAKELLVTFPSYFTVAEANQYTHQPEKIANKVYSNRMGNGNEASGDGYLFRGRGLIQLSGRSNYTLYSKNINKSIPDTINYLETIPGAVDVAGYFWNINNLNSFADKGDIQTITKRINGGLSAYALRDQLYNDALKVLN